VTMDAAVGSMGLPEGEVDEFVVGTGVGVLSTVGVVVSEFCVIGVESVVVCFDVRLFPRAHNPITAMSRTAAVIPIISPVRLLRGGVVGGIGNGCAGL